jgi:hypothetical protein
MPHLRPRQEAFARNIVKSVKDGTSIARAYEQSGYRTSGHASEAAASRLLKDVEVQRRIDELSRRAVQKSGVTIEKLLSELSRTIDDARSEKQNNVVVKALELSAKLVGLLREKVDVNVEYGGTREEIFGRLEERYGSDIANLLREALTEPANPPVISAKVERVTAKTARSQADIALEELRPRER